MRLTRGVGIASPNTLQVVEVGSPGLNINEPRTIAIWQSYDGVYVLDGVKPKKVSLPIDRYFNPEYSATAITAVNIELLQAFVDQNNNEYHLLLPNGPELVYNYVTDEWYPPWNRENTLNCGINMQDSLGRFYQIGASDEGWVYRLEDDTTDKNTSGSDVAIDHSIKTRAIAVGEQSSASLRFTLRRMWAEFKARASGSVTSKIFKDTATTGTDSDTMSMVGTGVGIVVPGREGSKEACMNFQAEFSLSSADEEMEIYSMEYELSPRGVPVIE
jgi:hypothetical protein